MMRMAEKFIKDSPTYKYDGYYLVFESYTALESIPVQHILTYKFKSKSAGYGDRSGMMTAQVITDHEISLNIMDESIVAAFIDSRWDEIQQKDIRSEDNNQESTNSKTSFLEYKPMQCVDLPWNLWLANSGIQFVKAPTEEEVIKMYYEHKGAVVESVVKVQYLQAVCLACGACPTGFKYVAEASLRKDIIIEDGWTVLRDMTTQDFSNLKADEAAASAAASIDEGNYDYDDEGNSVDGNSGEGAIVDNAIIGMPNPASKYCTDKGYTLDIRDTPEGQKGYCIFNDGKECEEWTYYRGECIE